MRILSEAGQIWNKNFDPFFFQQLAHSVPILSARSPAVKNKNSVHDDIWDVRHPPKLRGCRTSRYLTNLFKSRVFLQYFRHQNTAIFLLIVFNNSNKHSTDSKSCTIKRVNKL